MKRKRNFASQARMGVRSMAVRAKGFAATCRQDLVAVSKPMSRRMFVLLTAAVTMYALVLTGVPVYAASTVTNVVQTVCDFIRTEVSGWASLIAGAVFAINGIRLMLSSDDMGRRSAISWMKWTVGGWILIVAVPSIISFLSTNLKV